MAIEPPTGGNPCTEHDTPVISVIIPHYNDLSNLERCLALLDAQTLPRAKFEVVVADNNSSCGLNEVKRICTGRARIVEATVQGAGAARTQVSMRRAGEFLLFSDSDRRPIPTWLEHGLAALSKGQIVGGRVEVDYEDPQHPTAVEAFEKVFAFNFKRYIEKLGFSGSGNMFVSRETFDRVGGFRGQVAEDLDWGRRAVAANYRFRYARDVVVSHPARRNWRELTLKSRKATREAFAASAEKPYGRAVWVLRSVAILASPFFHWIEIARSEKLDGPGQRIKAVGVLFGIRFWRFIECNRLLLKP